jgi:hypothetical protein
MFDIVTDIRYEYASCERCFIDSQLFKYPRTIGQKYWPIHAFI